MTLQELINKIRGYEAIKGKFDPELERFIVDLCKRFAASQLEEICTFLDDYQPTEDGEYIIREWETPESIEEQKQAILKELK